MRELIGMCIENTSQISNTINVTLKINETMNKISGLMGNEEQAKVERPNATDLLESLSQTIGNVK